MIVSQLDAWTVSPENLIKDFQNELGYSFEIKSQEDLELEETELIDNELINEIADEILAEVKVVLCYACEAQVYGLPVPQELEPYGPPRPDDQKNEVYGLPVPKPIRYQPIKLPVKYHMMKKIYFRLNNFVEKLTTKYERLSNATNDGVKNLKPLRIISKLLEKINSVQEHFINRLERIERATGRDITTFDVALDKIQDLEDKLTYMQREILNPIRRNSLLKSADHILRMKDGVISCGF